jgi:hypothetical protein
LNDSPRLISLDSQPCFPLAIRSDTPDGVRSVRVLSVFDRLIPFTFSFDFFRGGSVSLNGRAAPLEISKPTF